MNVTAAHLAVAATLLWTGMLLGISFLEAPLKFRTPGLDLAMGLAIGRLVFRALHRVEIVWAVLLAVCLVLGRPPAAVIVPAAAAGAILVIQLVWVQPALHRRTDAVLAAQGADGPRSHAHLVFVVFEVLKVVALAVLAWRLLLVV